MSTNRLRVVVIGAGIHGLTASLALAARGAAVTLVERHARVLSGTSAATHNRAHRGYHYPRSLETADECLRGFSFFEQQFPEAIAFPAQNVYAIAAEGSHSSPDEFLAFCRAAKLECDSIANEHGWWSSQAIAEAFLVREGVFNLKVLSARLVRALADKAVDLRPNHRVTGIDRRSSGYRISGEQGREAWSVDCDVVVSATYGHANNVMAMAGVQGDQTLYRLQLTEVLVLDGAADAPALTVMDGPYASLMPHASSPGRHLLYDVVYSVVDEREGYAMHDDKPTSNRKVMLDHASQFYPFLRKLAFVKSLYGIRPIRKGALHESRATRIVHHEEAPGFVSILEGKFISAPLIAEDVAALVYEAFG